MHAHDIDSFVTADSASAGLPHKVMRSSCSPRQSVCIALRSLAEKVRTRHEFVRESGMTLWCETSRRRYSASSDQHVEVPRLRPIAHSIAMHAFRLHRRRMVRLLLAACILACSSVGLAQSRTYAPQCTLSRRVESSRRSTCDERMRTLRKVRARC
jgi:hypothetical protein